MRYSIPPRHRKEALRRLTEIRKRNDTQGPEPAPEPEPIPVSEWVRHVCPHERAFQDRTIGGYQCGDCGAVLEQFDPETGATTDDWRGGRSLHAVREKYRNVSVDKPEEGT